jgi:predicted DNA-binding transcriptional regulator YafY
VLALALAAGLARDSGDVDTVTLGAVIAKLEALVPPDTLSLLRRELARGRGNSTAARRSETLALLERAWLERRRVRMVYETGMRGGARSERVVEPYHLQHYGRFWILIAYDHLRQAVRDFKVDRIRAAVLLDEHYTIPDDFDLATYRGTTWGLLRGVAGHPVDVELLFSPQAGRWVQEEDWGVPLAIEIRTDGHVLVRMRIGITPEMVRWLLWYGSDCTILAPDSLRQLVRETADAIERCSGQHS